MLDLVKAMQDPEFLAGLQAMPQQIIDKLDSIETKLDLLLAQFGTVSEEANPEFQQNSNAANLQISENAFPLLDKAMDPNINPIDPDSYK